ncbi:acyltransferase [Arenimonas sp. MALMAid1274]|uniref:acyltransferase n=1 Tax=Arenimonas sp. MALMAid1274 TaxID=3411630 RepID=UPI003B9DCC4B
MTSAPRRLFTYLPVPLRAPLAALLVGTSTLLHVPVLLVVAITKLLLPLPAIRPRLDRALMLIAESWIAVNSALIDAFTRTRFVVEGVQGLRYGGHYLVFANHQSWVDIPVLQKVFNRRIPLLRFFLKSQLFWVPLLGLAWWALDFPFMKRYSRQQLARRPELAGRDLAVTRRACEKFRHIPVSVMNFVEGTRFTPGKHAAQGETYRHLLRPKAGGVAFVVGAMGDAIESVLDVTVSYDVGRPTLADLFADRIGEVRVHVRERALPAGFAGGDYEADPAFRERFQAWINGLWQEKDALLDTWAAPPHPAAGPEAS